MRRFVWEKPWGKRRFFDQDQPFLKVSNVTDQHRFLTAALWFCLLMCLAHPQVWTHANIRQVQDYESERQDNAAGNIRLDRQTRPDQKHFRLEMHWSSNSNNITADTSVKYMWSLLVKEEEDQSPSKRIILVTWFQFISEKHRLLNHDPSKCGNRINSAVLAVNECSLIIPPPSKDSSMSRITADYIWWRPEIKNKIKQVRDIWLQ